ncbi:MAG: serine/threonine-protein kinase [Gemmatimonadaceae bacterium]
MPAPVEFGPQFPDGTYVIEGVVGSGGMAVVYRARDLRRNRTVAVKVLRAEVSEFIGRERFQREIAVASAFSHPHILPLLDSGTLTDAQGRESPYYVMPLIDGETLRERIQRERRLPLRDALQIAREMLQALQYAHEHGVIHRDIKPANILLSSGHAIVADFGVARPLPGNLANNEALERLTSSGYAIGTPIYMSPEQALGDSHVDIRTDLYSAAAVLYEMLVGAPPFDAPTMQAMIARKVSGVFVPASAMRTGLPPALDRVLSVALSAEPSDRYANAAAFLSALEHIDYNTSANSQAVAPPNTRAPLRRILVGLGATALVAAVVLIVRAISDPAIHAAPPNSARIAVLPFELMSPDSTLEIVANGFTTDLIDELAQFPALTVVSKNGIAPYQNGKIPLDSMARTLRVGSIVTGDLRRIGDSVRLSVRLVDGATSQQLSKADVVGSVHDVLAMRSTMIDSVTRFLRKTIGQELDARERQQASNAEAWELVAKVQSMLENELRDAGARSPRERASLFAIADSVALKAANLDKRWARPLVLRGWLKIDYAAAEASARGASTNSANSDVVQMRVHAIEFANAALSRSHGDAAAFYMRGRALLDLWRASRTYSADSLRDSAERDFRAAVARRRDFGDAWADLSLLLQLSGEFDKSRQAAESALQADAFLNSGENVTYRAFFTSLASGKVASAHDWCTRGRARYPDDPRFWGCELTIEGYVGKTPPDIALAWKLLAAEEARDSTGRLASGWGTRRLMVAAIAARAGQSDSARAIVKNVRAKISGVAASNSADYGEAHVEALLGHPELAIPLLDRYLKQSPSMRGQVKTHPWFATLHNDARFVALTSHNK